MTNLIKKSIIVCLILTLATVANAQNINIPDALFKDRLINYHSPIIDTNGDGEISVSEAQAFTGTLQISNWAISDLTGIEYFTNITGLNCESNKLTTLNISNNTLLQYLNCFNNQNLTNLDVSNNTALTYLECSVTSLTSIDVSNNIALEDLRCGSPLTSLDVSNNTALRILVVSKCQLTNLDVSKNINLELLGIVDKSDAKSGYN